MEKVSFKEFANIVKNMKGCQFASIATTTDVKTKKGCPISGVRKVTRRTCQLNYDYENAVNNHLERNGGERNFVGGSLPWGAWAIPNKLISHKGKLYLRAYLVKGAANESKYIHADGSALTDSEVATINAYACSNGGSAKQAAAGLAEGEQVRSIAISFDSINHATIGGREYELYASDMADAIASL